MFKRLMQDVKSIRRRDPAAKSTIEVLLLYPGVQAVIWYRISHWFYIRNLYFLARMFCQLGRFFTGIEIHPGAKIGRGLLIDHGAGVVIGETAEVGDDCTIYQGVTLGGTGKDCGKRHPTLGNGVMVGAGSKVLGPFKVGNNVRIAANSVVLEAIPDNSTAVGSPARIVKVNGIKCVDLDQIHIPDPVAQQLCRLELRITQLEKSLSLCNQEVSSEDCFNCNERSIDYTEQ